MKNLISIVVPCYNEEEVLPLYMEQIAPVRSDLEESRTPASTEIIFVDDGSTDSTLKLIKSYNAADPSVRYISFSRNFGKESGIYAGLQAAHGDFVVLMDADLQHPVSAILRMYELLTSKDPEQASDSIDAVAMFRTNRLGERPIRSFFAKRFYRFMNRLSNLNLVEGATDYRMMRRRVVDAVLEMRECNRFTKGIFSWVGFNTRWLPYDNIERAAGTTKWSFRSLVSYSLDGIFAFSTKPLTISFGLGLILCLLALIYAVIVAVRTIIWGDPVAGFPSLFCMILFLGGIELLLIGVEGQYIARMYLETKHRPVFIIREKSE